MAIRQPSARASAVTAVTMALCVFLYACGGGGAQEPRSQPVVTGGGVSGGVTNSGSGGGSVAGGSGGAPAAPAGAGSFNPNPADPSNPANPANPVNPVTPVNPAGTPDGSGVASVNSCSIAALNNGRFSGTGLVVTGIDSSSQCPFCPSGESCTSPAGGCVCLLVVPR